MEVRAATEQDPRLLTQHYFLEADLAVFQAWRDIHLWDLRAWCKHRFTWNNILSSTLTSSAQDIRENTKAGVPMTSVLLQKMLMVYSG